MHTDWNFVLNLLFFIVVVAAIIKIIKGKYKYANTTKNLNSRDNLNSENDDIIAVRKINKHQAEEHEYSSSNNKTPKVEKNDKNVMLLLLAKDNSKFVGFDLLHTLLAGGLRYGDGQLFHYYKDNGQGAYVFSVAAATNDGTFDLNTIKEFSVSGLCMYFKPSGIKQEDTESFRIMYDEAIKLAKVLDAHILDERQNILNDDSILRYYQAF